MSDIQWVKVYDYDFNNIHGHALVRDGGGIENLPKVGEVIALVCMDDSGFQDSGFGCLATVTGLWRGVGDDAWVIETDHSRRRFAGSAGGSGEADRG